MLAMQYIDFDITLFGPIDALVAQPDHSEEVRARIMARYAAEHNKLIREFQAFTLGEPSL